METVQLRTPKYKKYDVVVDKSDGQIDNKNMKISYNLYIVIDIKWDVDYNDYRYRCIRPPFSGELELLENQLI